MHQAQEPSEHIWIYGVKYERPDLLRYHVWWSSHDIDRSENVHNDGYKGWTVQF